MIQNIIDKEIITTEQKLNIVYNKSENQSFRNFIQKLFSYCFLIEHNDTIYGMNNPNIVICSDRQNLQKSIDICYFFHIPLLLVDNAIKNNSIETIPINFSPVYKIALSNKIFNSWNRIHDKILNFDPYSELNKSEWKNIILTLCKQVFIINEDKNNE
jgi:hypothetical protein